MSLTLALSIVGGLVILALLLQGWLSTRKAAPKRAEPVSPAPSDTHESGERREPSLHDAEPGAGDPAHDPLFDLPPDGTESAAADGARGDGGTGRPLRRRLPARLDALIDAIAPLTVEQPLAAEVVIAQLPATRRAGTKPFLIEGLNTESGEWEPPRLGQRYGEFQAGLQMANRHGALNEIEYSEFVQTIEQFAQGIGATADFPDMLDVVARARELDQFAGQHDAQLAVQLRARGAAWSVGYVQQHAGRCGFLPGVVPGRLILPASEEGAPPVLTLTFDSQIALADDPNQAALRQVMLAFDVPQTDAAETPFQTWQNSAQALSQALEADVIDDRGQLLREASFTAIGNDLGQLYAALAERDLAAGSRAARRLFS